MEVLKKVPETPRSRGTETGAAGVPQGDTRGDLVLRVRQRIRTVNLIGLVVNFVGAHLISMLALYIWT